MMETFSKCLQAVYRDALRLLVGSFDLGRS